MPTYSQRRDSILSQFAQSKQDLENLNAEIQASIDEGQAQIAAIAAQNKELLSLKVSNEDSIQMFSKFLKKR